MFSSEKINSFCSRLICSVKNQFQALEWSKFPWRDLCREEEMVVVNWVELALVDWWEQPVPVEGFCWCVKLLALGSTGMTSPGDGKNIFCDP